MNLFDLELCVVMFDASKQPLKERLLRGGFWAFIGKVVTALAGLAINVLLARLLTPEAMGTYFLIFSLVSLAAVIAQFGLTQAVVRMVAGSLAIKRLGRARQAIVWSIWTVVIGSLVVSSYLMAGGGEWVAKHVFHSQMMLQVMGMTSIWVIIYAFQGLIAEIFRAFHDIRLATIFGGLLTSVLAVLLFFMLWLLFQGQVNLDQVMFLMLLAGGTSLCLSVVFLCKKIKTLPIVENEIDRNEFMHICWPLWVTMLTIFVLTQVDIWVLGFFYSQEDVAVYGAAVRMVALVTMPLLIVNAVVPPIVSDLHSRGEIDSLENALRLTASFAGIPALLVLMFFMFYSDSILVLLFGEFYRAGGTVLAILSLGQLANVWAGSCGLTLMLTGHQRTMMTITLFSGLITIMLSISLVSPYGGSGVASAVAIGMFVQNILMLIWAKKKVGVWTYAGFSPVFNAGKEWLKTR